MSDENANDCEKLGELFKTLNGPVRQDTALYSIRYILIILSRKIDELRKDIEKIKLQLNTKENNIDDPK